MRTAPVKEAHQLLDAIADFAEGQQLTMEVQFWVKLASELQAVGGFYDNLRRLDRTKDESVERYQGQSPLVAGQQKPA